MKKTLIVNDTRAALNRSRPIIYWIENMDASVILNTHHDFLLTHENAFEMSCLL